MNSILATAHTWFLESYEQDSRGTLSIHLVEGKKGYTRLPVHIEEKLIGSFFPVTIEPHSRCVIVTFSDVRALFTFNESFDTKDPKMELGEGRFIRQVLASSFRDFTTATTTALEEFRGECFEWLVWTEDHILQVFSSAAPEVCLVDRAPDFTIQRGETWSAS